jgi:large subunit ribosomal protein L23
MGIFDKIIGKKEEAKDQKKAEKNPEAVGAGKTAQKDGAASDEKAKTKPATKKPKTEKVEKPAKKKKLSEKNIEKKEENVAFQVLHEPVISEKSTEMGASNKYVFKVAKDANKHKIKQVIEGYYGVGVVKVNIVKIQPKKRVHGRTIGWKKGFKKAIVTLREGDTIGVVEGV